MGGERGFFHCVSPKTFFHHCSFHSTMFSRSSLAVPTAELVKRVKELYHKRVSDVRFLIPVLTGLKKQEIIAVLPKLIKQSPSVVKEVFNRLLGCFHSKHIVTEVIIECFAKFQTAVLCCHF